MPHWRTFKRTRPNGVTVEVIGKPLPDGGFVTTYSDITEREHAEQALRASEQRYRALVELLPEAIFMLRQQHIVYANASAFTLLGASSAQQVLKHDIGEFIHPDSAAQLLHQLAQFDAASSVEPIVWQEQQYLRLDGQVVPVETTLTRISLLDGAVTLQVVRDMTLAKAQQHQLEHMAHNDMLTNLPNRVLLADRLHQAMTQSQRHGRYLVVVYLDLDGFKTINDRYGHSVGDQLLVALSQRMKTALRDGDTLARMGGDEFVAVLVDLQGAQDYHALLERLLQAAAAQIQVDALLLQVSASIGITFYPQDHVDADQLLRHADQAMYLAKQDGKNRYRLFDIAQEAQQVSRSEHIEAIRLALQRQEFVLYYQPKVNLQTGQVIGAEALLRWSHPEQGLLAPAAFLPMIENHPISVELGEWVIARALAQMAKWRCQGLTLPVSVNINALQLQQDNFAEQLQSFLQAQPSVPAHCLELEVLETSVLENANDKVGRIMQRVHTLGVSFALDDFGTGYSSLTHLRHLPAATVKIDQSFVRDMLTDPDDLAIVQGVVGLASAFHRKVIAEGVESAAHASLLLRLGCALAQGYGVARPMPADDIPAWISSWQTSASWTA